MQFGLRAADPPRAIEVRPRLERAGPVALIGLAALAPLAFGTGSDVLHDMVLTAAYVVMALGLNLVVGFAGLLDLGYVASSPSAPTRPPTSPRASGRTPGTGTAWRSS